MLCVCRPSSFHVVHYISCFPLWDGFQFFSPSLSLRVIPSTITTTSKMAVTNQRLKYIDAVCVVWCHLFASEGKNAERECVLSVESWSEPNETNEPNIMFAPDSLRVSKFCLWRWLTIEIQKSNEVSFAYCWLCRWYSYTIILVHSLQQTESNGKSSAPGTLQWGRKCSPFRKCSTVSVGNGKTCFSKLSLYPRLRLVHMCAKSSAHFPLLLFERRRKFRGTNIQNSSFHLSFGFWLFRTLMRILIRATNDFVYSG